MSYTLWSVVFGEQPSASKWNILGTNDASFNDGTGIGTNAILAASLATNAITLGYASSTSVFSTSNTSATQVTGLTTTVTIPAGGRRVEITAYSPQVGSSNANITATVSIWDGTVGSGTKLTDGTVISVAGGTFCPVTIQAIVAPSAGSKTYNVGFHSNTPSVDFYGGATRPSFLLVKTI